MRILHQPCLAALLLFLAAVPLVSRPAEASHYRGAVIAWCPSPQADGSLQVWFYVQVTYEGDAYLGYPTLETFHFGDGTSAQMTLRAFALHAAQPHGWFDSEGIVGHLYAPGATPVEAGLETCCRSNGALGSFDLNDRSFGPFHVKVRIEADPSTICANYIANPNVEWVSGGIGNTFEIGVQPGDHNPQTCRLATEAEVGGGPLAELLTVDPETCVLTWTPVSGDPEKLWTTQVRVTQEGVGESTVDLMLGLDADKPICKLQRIDSSQPVRAYVLVHDPRSGLRDIFVTQAVNTQVQVPSFQYGDAVPLTVVATKIQQGVSSRFQLRVVDVAFNQIECDPILTEVVRENGQPERHTYTDIPPEEHLVTVYNGDPGLRNLAVEVNGRRFEMAGLRPREERTIDVASAITPRVRSTFTLIARGQPGGSALVLIADGGQ